MTICQLFVINLLLCVCLFVCLLVCMFVIMYVIVHVCLSVCLYDCFFVCLFVYIYIYVCVCAYVCVLMCLCASTCMCICVCVCVCVCVCRICPYFLVSVIELHCLLDIHSLTYEILLLPLENKTISPHHCVILLYYDCLIFPPFICPHFSLYCHYTSYQRMRHYQAGSRWQAFFPKSIQNLSEVD